MGRRNNKKNSELKGSVLAKTIFLSSFNSFTRRESQNSRNSSLMTLKPVLIVYLLTLPRKKTRIFFTRDTNKVLTLFPLLLCKRFEGFSYLITLFNFFTAEISHKDSVFTRKNFFCFLSTTKLELFSNVSRTATDSKWKSFCCFSVFFAKWNKKKYKNVFVSTHIFPMMHNV